MSPPTTSQSMPNTLTRPNPLTATKIGSETNIDTSISVIKRQKGSFFLLNLIFI
jgi:hypothetical protein